MARPIDPNAAVDYLIEVAPQFAKAKAERIYLEEFRKSNKKDAVVLDMKRLPLQRLYIVTGL